MNPKKWWYYCRMGRLLTSEDVEILDQFESDREFDQYLDKQLGNIWLHYKVNTLKCTVGGSLDLFYDSL